MKKTVVNALFALSLFITLPALAGETHKGNGLDRESACAAADRRAQTAANKKGTCITACEIDSCKKESDGTFTCVATSANHKGSCPNR
jgi:hypothetical protein